ncbi:VOC family protein [Nocardia sp. NPDC005978]|uniref:VOC family protein n=1 Tax=unclassified Nocardia TaxID=2637762 RepID=UPI00339F4944
MSESASTKTLTTIWPALIYRDADAAISFLENVFGFECTARHGSREVVDHAELRWPTGGGIMLGSVREDSALSGQPAGVGAIYIVTAEPDAIYARAVAAGATVIRELRDETDYESRGFTCRDPEGVYWSFGTFAGE